MSDSPGPDSTIDRKEIHRQARERVGSSALAGGRSRRGIISVVTLFLILISLAVATLLFTRQAIRRRSQEAATSESRFVTTEWALLREIQQRTERVLRDKDREIASLRELQASLAGRPGLEEEAEQVRLAIAQAYAERETVLQARLSGSDQALAQAVRSVEQSTLEREERATDGAAESGPQADGAQPPLPAAQMISPDDPATLAWYRQIVDQLRAGRPDAAQVRLETSGERSAVLPAEDFDRLLGLVTLLERQEAFLETVRGLQRELDRREAQIADRNQAIRELTTEVGAARTQIQRLEDELQRVTAQRLSAEDAAALREEVRESLDALETERALTSQLRTTLSNAETTNAEIQLALAERQRQLSELERLLEQERRELSGAQLELEAVRDALADSREAYTELVVQKEIATAEAFEQATEQTFAAAERLLDYLAGSALEDTSTTRDQILAFWNESQRYQELLTRARRLADGGVADDRNDLPAPRLVGVVTDVREQTVLIESLTDVTADEGTRVEIRSPDGVQPGELVAVATIDVVAGDLVSARLAERSRMPRVRDLVYVVLIPDGER